MVVADVDVGGWNSKILDSRNEAKSDPASEGIECGSAAATTVPEFILDCTIISCLEVEVSMSSLRSSSYSSVLYFLRLCSISSVSPPTKPMVSSKNSKPPKSKTK